MSNQWFQFKQFKIRQDRCAMKVGTDGVLLGAWAELYSGKRILDIGSGTGLISLMMAQRFEDAEIVGVELEESAAMQAMENVEESEYARRIEIKHCSLAEYLLICERKFDLLVCNPPFFVGSKKAETEGRSLARHADKLNLGHLMRGASQLLNDEGSIALVLPMEQRRSALTLAAFNKLCFQRELVVRTVPLKQAKRVCLQFGMKSRELFTEELVIEDAGRHGYSSDYINLTKDFYLHF